MSIKKGLIDLFFPEHCLHCGAKTIVQNTVSLCLPCEAQLEVAFLDVNGQNSLRNKFKGIFDVKHAFSLYVFSLEGVSQSLIHEAKYKNKMYLFEHYAKILAHKTITHNLFDSELPDLIVPVPNHWFKRMKTGYNQAEVFAKSFGDYLGVHLESNALKKHFDMYSQTKRNKVNRLLRLKTLYSHSKNSFKLKDKHVLLIDDVITSGATIETCVNLLLKADVKKISVVSFMMVK